MNKVSVIIPVYNVEKYIRDMLRSVADQSFGDFEAIIVNDGSTDGSRQIIEEFCRSDSRFRCYDQSNRGVSSARNKGIDLASGEYVVFYDPDDYVPPHALKAMYQTASQNNADMVIGVMVEKSLGETFIYTHSQKLAKKRHISCTDKHFIGAWSLCSKMFSLRFIRENHLRFEKLHNAEDGVFNFCVLNCSPSIVGCDVIAYNYIRRPFWTDSSATQKINREYFSGLLESHDRIIEEVNKLIEKIDDPCEKQEYIQSVYSRFIGGEMINAYYRLIWKAQDDVISLLRPRVEAYRSYLSQEAWEAILRRNSDLELEKGFMTAVQMAADPIVTIAVTGHFEAGKLDMVLGSMYNQLFPRFEVLIDKELYAGVPDVYREKTNLRAIEGGMEEAFKMSRGRYIIFINEFAMFTKNSLLLMARRLEKNTGLAFVSMLMKGFDGVNYAPIPALSAAYGYTGRGKRHFGKLSECDMFMCNKLFRKAALEGFKFSENSDEDMRKLYTCLSFERLRKAAMITDITEEKILARALHRPSDAAIKLSFFQNEKISGAIEGLKRHITREDIENLKKRLGLK